MNTIVQGEQYPIPQWLPFHIAAGRRENTAFLKPQDIVHRSDSRSFQSDWIQFNQSSSPALGAELMGRAHILGKISEANELANYVIRQPDVNPVAKIQAHSILGSRVNPHNTTQHEYDIVRRIKRHLKEFPNDAVSWTDLSRIYTVLGLKKQAKRAMFVAISLQPSNRWIVRAFARLCVHYEDWDIAETVLRRAYEQNPDPLIYAPLLSVAIHLEKAPKDLKKIANACLDSDDKFLYSEISEAMGLLETLDKAPKKALKFLRNAWIDPTHTVVTHSQWILREYFPNIKDPVKIDFGVSTQAVSWLRHSMLDFQGTVHGCNSWILEEPFSRAPYILGSVSACQMEDFAAAEEICLRGLNANPKDHVLTNNLCFALLRNGKPEKAKELFGAIKHHVDSSDEIATTATYGLMLMCDGDTEQGADFYGKAIQRAIDLDDRKQALRASLNYIISLIDTARKVDKPALEHCINALKIGDAGCHGAALAIARRLRRQDSGTERTTFANYAERIEKSASEYKGAMQQRFMQWLQSDLGVQDQNIAQEIQLPLEEAHQPHLLITETPNTHVVNQLTL